ncbi:hypothetical protein TSUD_238680 [Trifolium subterraneum]|uniref:Uncharacterized protein n=1 Tax=Trifolium subterraneum TaxID=3900 RepID=A0A2Z6PHY8_TRISU|nr:hypothetical protein TSUD_238680 [Trifolium subterraneum]
MEKSSKEMFLVKNQKKMQNSAAEILTSSKISRSISKLFPPSLELGNQKNESVQLPALLLKRPEPPPDLKPTLLKSPTSSLFSQNHMPLTSDMSLHSPPRPPENNSSLIPSSLPPPKPPDLFISQSPPLTPPSSPLLKPPDGVLTLSPPPKPPEKIFFSFPASLRPPPEPPDLDSPSEIFPRPPLTPPRPPPKPPDEETPPPHYRRHHLYSSTVSR